ncbi:MAG: hypothetical protein IPK50_14965 [Fibrobacterota bacterium]|nr:hypothetical protein [Fibrobacterota bacterium]QQS03593.1 MAG: hypothetical protein IPK50_14965 [Fibrobacterota bacterium]
MQGKMSLSEAQQIFSKYSNDPSMIENVSNTNFTRIEYGSRLFFGLLPLSQFFLPDYADSRPLSAPPDIKKNYEMALLDEKGRPTSFKSIDDLGVARYGGMINYIGDSSWISIKANLEQRFITGGTIFTSRPDGTPSQGFRFYRTAETIDEINYIFEENFCKKVIAIRYTGENFAPAEPTEYTFIYDNSSILKTVLQNDSRIVYQSPKNLSKEASLIQVMAKLSKEISTFTTKAFPLKDITGIGIFYDVISKFSNLSISVTSQSLLGVSKLTDEEIVTLFDLQEEEFYELEDFETNSFGLKKHLQFLESNWKTTDAEFSEEMNRFCDHLLELVKKKHPNVAYVFWCDRECTNLAKNIRKLASEN